MTTRLSTSSSSPLVLTSVDCLLSPHHGKTRTWSPFLLPHSLPPLPSPTLLHHPRPGPLTDVGRGDLGGGGERLLVRPLHAVILGPGHAEVDLAGKLRLAADTGVGLHVGVVASKERAPHREGDGHPSHWDGGGEDLLVHNLVESARAGKEGEGRRMNVDL